MESHGVTPSARRASLVERHQKRTFEAETHVFALEDLAHEIGDAELRGLLAEVRGWIDRAKARAAKWSAVALVVGCALGGCTDHGTIREECPSDAGCEVDR